ncbi:AHH domain-containing protein [Archangium sp.]|uniref:AHH domain-containing protein n=1 Tax=Archangium sp. TaxID=1872627 RepID=UPI00286C5A20|nr:AHH domain-containing protein [Archangium sp.]
MRLRSAPILYLLLLLSPLARADPSEVESRLLVLQPVGVSEHHSPTYGLGLKLTFKQLRLDSALARFPLEEARSVVTALEQEFKAVRSRSGARLLASSPLAMVATGSTNTQSSELEKRVREHYEALYGPSALPLSPSLESARWFQALALSPRYMDEGVREAAVELFNSPTVLLSVAMSMLLYMTAWAAPEPLFSKAFAAAVTIGLLMTYTTVELYNVGQACLALYRQAEAATSVEQLNAVAERFGKAIGGVGLRVLVTLAGARLARGLPEVPKGGIWARLSPPRFAFAGGGAGEGLMFGSGARAQVAVADGTVVLMGVSASTTAHAASAAVVSTRTTGACRDASNKGDAKGHHIATDKNDKSEISGGPWTPRFQELFARAGMELDDPANMVYLIAHQGPHPEAYHREVYRRLEDALGVCQTRLDCRPRLVEELDRLAADICKPGSRLNAFATKKP